MDFTTYLDRLEAGESTAGILPRGRLPGLGEAYFNRLIGYYGSDNERLQNLGRHWRRVLERAPDKAWVYRAGGIHERARGRFSDSAVAFVRAGNTATGRVAKYSFQVGAIDSFARAGRLAEAEDLAESVSVGLMAEGQPGLAARALLNFGNALIYQDRMPEARIILERALPGLVGAGYLLEATSAQLALSSTHLFGGDPRSAEQLATEVVRAASEIDADYLGDLAQLNLALAMIVTSRPEEAHRLLLELRPNLEDSEMDSLRAAEYLGDALFRLNLWEEAELAYREVLASRTVLVPLHRANLELGLGQALMAQGRPDEAVASLKHALRGYRRIQNQAWQAVCLLQLALIEIDGGDKRKALKLLAEAESLSAGSPFHLAQILLAQSKIGEDRSVEAHRLIRRFGYVDLEWQVHWIRAKRSPSPLPHYRRMFRAILVGRLATRSVAARIGFLKDKSEALQAYLGWLLAKPSPSRVAEATQAILQVRSVTLIDEILHRDALPTHVVESLSRVRQELESSLDDTPSGGARRVSSGLVSIGRAQRSAMEALLAMELSTQPKADLPRDGVVLAETNLGMRMIIQGNSLSPRRTDDKIREALRWLSFEMVAPMTDPKADSAPVMRILDQLASAFGPIWDSGLDWICPDGFGWRVPWSLCSQRAGLSRPWALAMHPRMNHVLSSQLTTKSRVAVWLGQAEDLPFARREAEAVASQFDHCDILTTREEARKSLAKEFDVLHVVAHAVHRPLNPMLSSIQFADGPIFGYEIARSPLQIRLATLSACETGSISLASRTEPDGLARAFITRGAESVVASQWPLDDEAAFIQFRSIYEDLFRNGDLRDAILRAQCICREVREHPYFWGALALYSGYSE